MYGMAVREERAGQSDKTHTHTLGNRVAMIGDPMGSKSAPKEIGGHFHSTANYTGRNYFEKPE